ncbi:MAG: helix-turn-helix domain-containing protein [Candidatus Dojkabacteria bacterium]|jgi:predicted transcriptional regulator|nr:helix-turn-helix domain-containing protein [Candidatus Dojkabacteria bacterium]
MIDNRHKVLEKYGLSDKEIIVYLECLKHSESSPYSLSKATKIPRTTIYDVLMDLALKNLVELEQSDGFTKQQTRVKAKNPSELRKNIRERRQSLEDLEIDLLEILPELKGTYHKERSPNAAFQFYPGIEGAKKTYYGLEGKERIYDDIAWTYLIRADAFGHREIDKDMASENRKLRLAGRKIREIVPLNDWTRDILVYTHIQNPDFMNTWDYRYVDSPMFKMYLRFAVAGTRIRITSIEDDEMWGVMINSKLLSDSIRSIFELTWTLATPVTEKILKEWKRESVFSRVKRKANSRQKIANS